MRLSQQLKPQIMKPVMIMLLKQQDSGVYTQHLIHSNLCSFILIVDSSFGVYTLTALLNQNPNIHAGTLSPVFELMYYTNEILHKEQAKAFPKPKIFQEIVTNTLINYYSDVKNPVVIDKCRMPAHIDIMKKYVTDNPKIICTVRHPLDILASFITLFHKDGTYNFIDRVMTKNKIPITDDNRCHYMMNPGGIVWESMNALYQRLDRKRHNTYILYNMMTLYQIQQKQ